MDFQPGDRVRIRQWDDMAAEFGYYDDYKMLDGVMAKRIKTPVYYFIQEARHLCGQEFEVSDIDASGVVAFTKESIESGPDWGRRSDILRFTVNMIEPLHCAVPIDDSVFANLFT